MQLLADRARHPTLVLFLAYTGLRWGEATALRVRQVDPLRRRVSVEENAVLVSFDLFDDDLDAVSAALDRAKRDSDIVKVLSRERGREA